MDVAYLQELMDKTAFPAQAREFLLPAAERLNACAAGSFRKLAAAYPGYAREEVLEGGSYGHAARRCKPTVEAIALEAGLSPYTVWLFLLIEASRPLRGTLPEEIFWETFSDLRFKALECKEVQGVWGNFVADWYAIFFVGNIVKLGRLEFETSAYSREEPVTAGGITLGQGDRVFSIHIPSSGEPFDRETRLAAYRKAYDFFREELGGGPLVCVCHSWLLYPPYREILSPGSNIVDFMGDFDILGQDEDREFGDSWRLFGADYQKPYEQLPEGTSMQRAFKKYLLEGGVPGCGRGVLVFDGEKLLTGRQG